LHLPDGHWHSIERRFCGLSGSHEVLVVRLFGKRADAVKGIHGKAMVLFTIGLDFNGAIGVTNHPIPFATLPLGDFRNGRNAILSHSQPPDAWFNI
jgi:hypothetical protein